MCIFRVYAVTIDAYAMRYHYSKPECPPKLYAFPYICNHVVYDSCSLFRMGDKGLSVIQQRYDKTTKRTYWGPIDPWLTEVLYLNPRFNQYFEKYAQPCTDGLYPTVTIRQMMWALKIKPIKREPWETCFDHCPI